MLEIIPSEVSVPKLHHFLLGSIGPRPICFASTIDLDGNKNLSPFSFFNVFSANPPILIFSPARSGRTGAHKDTYLNVKQVAEVVINVVNYDMTHQMNLSSSPFDKNIDEFTKSGFTPIPSDLVKPYRVAESPVQIECKVIEIKELGEGGGAGNLIICEVVKMHIDERVLDDSGVVDQTKIDLIGRMGGDWYCRANGDALYEVPKMLARIGIGIDSLPEKIKHHRELTGNELGILGTLSSIPSQEDIDNEIKDHNIQDFSLNEARKALNQHHVHLAYAILTKCP